MKQQIFAGRGRGRHYSFHIFVSHFFIFIDFRIYCHYLVVTHFSSGLLVSGSFATRLADLDGEHGFWLGRKSPYQRGCDRAVIGLVVPRLYHVASFEWHLRIFGQIGKLNRDLIIILFLFLISVVTVVIRHFVVVLLHRFASFGLLGLGNVFRISQIAFPGWP